MSAAEIRTCRIEGIEPSRRRWHLDETFVKINGERHCLRRAVDHDGDAPNSFATKKRDRSPTPKFPGKATCKRGRPPVIVTDGPRSKGTALRDVGAEHRQETGAGRTTEWRIRISLSDNGNGRFCTFGGCKVRETRRRLCLGLQPFQPGAQPQFQSGFQAEPRCRSCRVARSLPGTTCGFPMRAQTGSNQSAGTCSAVVRASWTSARQQRCHSSGSRRTSDSKRGIERTIPISVPPSRAFAAVFAAPGTDRAVAIIRHDRLQDRFGDSAPDVALIVPVRKPE